jgi:NADPH-dependent ferric siderophore reductase
MPSVAQVRHEVRVRLLEVREVEELTPRMRRITLTGDLSGFASDGADDHVKLFFGPNGTPPVLPNLGDGPQYPEGVEPPAMRDFTPRRFDVERGELVVDFALHGAGPAATWAASARPGSMLGQAGPRGSRVVSDDFAWYLLAGDETALPSIARRLEELPASARAIVIAEVDNADERIELQTEAQLEQTWIYRADGDPGAFDRAIRTVTFPAGDGFVWIAGEAETIRPLREHIRGERAHPKAFMHLTDYWTREGANNHDPRPEARAAAAARG